VGHVKPDHTAGKGEIGKLLPALCNNVVNFKNRGQTQNVNIQNETTHKKATQKKTHFVSVVPPLSSTVKTRGNLLED